MLWTITTHLIALLLGGAAGYWIKAVGVKKAEQDVKVAVQDVSKKL